MGCGDACPIFPGKRYEDWVLDDPAGQGVEAVRPIRDAIEARVRALIADLTWARFDASKLPDHRHVALGSLDGTPGGVDAPRHAPTSWLRA